MLADWPLEPGLTYLNHGTVGVAPRLFSRLNNPFETPSSGRVVELVRKAIEGQALLESGDAAS